MMQLHDAIRELVRDHGEAILSEASGFRGVLDDVLAEDQASTGDINLLVDAVRFDVLAPLVAMIDGGADPARAVEEAGLRLARERGGDDHVPASWAAAVLGYAVGRVPEAVLLRFRTQRRPNTELPPPASPPVTSPPPTSRPLMSPAFTAPPPGSPPPPPLPSTQWPSPVPHGSAKKKGPLLWVAAAVAAVVVVAGTVTAVALSGGDDDPAAKKPDDPSSSATTPEVDVTPEALDERYNALASAITSGAEECEAQSPGAGQSEVVQCTVNAGLLRLVTYADEESMAAARAARLDYRAGTMTADNGGTALYEFDPERGGSTDPAIVYWDSRPALQSAMITGDGTAKIDTLTTAYTATSPRVPQPTNPAHPVLREFIAINMTVSDCTRQRTFFVNETEESTCAVKPDGIVVNVGRFTTRKGLRKDRKYYKSQYEKAGDNGGTLGSGGTWKFGEGKAEGAYYAFLDAEGETATLYWDWNRADCHCYGVAWSFDGDLAKLEKWWPSDD